jgi:branched-chain amino acid transport system ATP-binding protein
MAKAPLKKVKRMEQWVLETKKLSKEFKGFLAVSEVDIRIAKGHIHALIGPNGAGKTTVFNLLTRFITPTSGSIFFNGANITKENPADIALRGVVRSFQISAVFPGLTPFENVRVALQSRLGTAYHFWKPMSSLAALSDRAMELLEAVGLEGLAHRPTVELAYGRKRALEIATTLALEPEMMLLDEPTQGMGAEDVERITDLVRKVAASRTILMVEHNLKVVARLADRITVLNRGTVLAEGEYEEISRNPLVMEAYMGSENG